MPDDSVTPREKFQHVHRNALVAIATAAVIDDQFCAHDVIELLNAFGLRSVVVQAREQAKRRKA